MKLISLTLTNFMGVRNFVLDADGESASIYGDNASGKTTLCSAFYFVLFGKDAAGNSPGPKFCVKTLDASGEPIHNLDHTVEAVFDTITLKRTYHEVYMQQRGGHAKEFTGHTTDYAINGVPVDEAQYNATVAGICREDVFRLITDPSRFAALEWDKRRLMLMNAFAAEYTDAAVIAANPELERLAKVIGKHSIDDYKKIAESQRKTINESLRTIPAAINELTNLIADPPTITVDIDKLRMDLAAAIQERAYQKAGAGGAQLAVDVSKAENAVASYESARRREYDELYSAESAERRRKRTDLGDAEQAVTNLTRSIAADKAEHAKIEARLLTLRGEFARIKAEAEAGFQGSTDCPACGQELPADRREEAVAKFNNAIATRRGDNMAEGKKTAARAKEMAEQIRQACAELTAAQETVDRLRAEIDNMGEPAPFTVDKSAPDYAALVARVTRLKRELADSAKADTTEIDAKISRLEAMRQKHDADCAVIAQQASIEARIKKLTEDEAAATATAEELRFNLDLIESFVRAKVKMVTCVINSHFKMAEFKLFSEQVNGGIKECCDITYAGVPWGSLNTGHKIRTALDVIATFQQVYNFSAPVWVDNAESNNEWPAMDCQIIRLYVSHDPALRVGFPTIAELLRVTADKATGGNDYDTRTDEGAEPTEQGELF